ncbi:MAG: hypothetical protein IJ828_08865, partial [Treponema sp.]|nr:hypothetical protein [Treponema sp.]
METVQATGNRTSKGIHGLITDDQGRCIHYNSVLDIVANRCSVCKKLYSCYKCHNELEDHPFGAVSETEPDSVMCGVCGSLYSYKAYSSLTSCRTCGSSFNP